MADYTSPFSTGIQFLDRLGVYEVLLPFLLIFTLVFAILEKTRLLGVENVEDLEGTTIVDFLSLPKCGIVTAFNISRSAAKYGVNIPYKHKEKT